MTNNTLIVQVRWTHSRLIHWSGWNLTGIMSLKRNNICTFKEVKLLLEA